MLKEPKSLSTSLSLVKSGLTGIAKMTVMNYNIMNIPCYNSHESTMIPKIKKEVRGEMKVVYLLVYVKG